MYIHSLGVLQAGIVWRMPCIVMELLTATFTIFKQLPDRMDLIRVQHFLQAQPTQFLTLLLHRIRQPMHLIQVIIVIFFKRFFFFKCLMYFFFYLDMICEDRPPRQFGYVFNSGDRYLDSVRTSAPFDVLPDTKVCRPMFLVKLTARGLWLRDAC